MVIVLMGTTGAGKTTVGKALAARLGWRFVDGDDYHPPANVAKMRRNQPLDDADRAPWLASLRQAIEGWLAAEDEVVLACSALKRAYRDQLRAGPAVRIVYLGGDYATIEQRLREREGHFATTALLASQFAALEEPAPDEDVARVSIEGSPEAVADAVIAALRLAG